MVLFLQAMLLQYDAWDAAVAELLIEAGAQLSDDFLVTAARAGNTNLYLWSTTHSKLGLPASISPYMQATLDAFGAESTSDEAILNDSSSTDCSLELPAAVAACPKLLHDVVFVAMSCLHSSDEGPNPMAPLLQQHRATAFQWTVDQVLQLLQLALQHQLDVVLQHLMEQLVVPAVQQQLLSRDHEQQLQVLVDLAAEKGMLDTFWPLCGPHPLPPAALLRLLHVVVDSRSSSLEFLLQQQAIQRFRYKDVEELLLKVAGQTGYNGTLRMPLQMMLSRLPGARAIAATIAERLLRAAVEGRASPGGVLRGVPSARVIPVQAVKEVIASAIKKELGELRWVQQLPSAQQLSLEAVSGLVSLAVQRDVPLTWVQGLPAAAAMPREVMLHHLQEALQLRDQQHGAGLLRLPAAAALTVADVEGLMMAAFRIGRDSSGSGSGWGGAQEQQQEHRGGSEHEPRMTIHLLATPLLQSQAAQQLVPEMVLSMLFEVAELQGMNRRSHERITDVWSALCRLPAVAKFMPDQLQHLLQLAVQRQLPVMILLQRAAVGGPLPVEQLLVLLQLWFRFCGRAVHLQELLLLPAAQQLTADQVQPLLFGRLVVSGEHFWQLPAAKHFSLSQAVELLQGVMGLRDSILEEDSIYVSSVADTIICLLKLPVAEQLPPPLVCKLLLLLLECISCCGFRHHYVCDKWENLAEAEVLQRLPLEQVMELLGAGFETGFVPGLLWRLPATRELSVEQVQQAIAPGKWDWKPEGEEADWEPYSNNIEDVYGLCDLLLLPAVQQLPAPVLLRLLHYAVSEQLWRCGGECAVDVIVKLPAASSIPAADICQLLKYAIRWRDRGMETKLLLGLAGAQAMGPKEVLGLSHLAWDFGDWEELTDFLRLPGARALSVGDVRKLMATILEDMLKYNQPIEPPPAAVGAAGQNRYIIDMFRCLCSTIELPAVQQMEVWELWRLLVQLPAVMARDLRWFEGCMWIVGGPQPHNHINPPSPYLAWLQMRQGEYMLQCSLAWLLELPAMQQQHLPEDRQELQDGQQQPQLRQQEQLEQQLKQP